MDADKEMSAKLASAISFAVAAHAGQYDRRGEPYYLHPLRVAMQQKTLKRMIIAVLHDVMEDCGVSFEKLEAEFGTNIAEAVFRLSREEYQSWKDYLEKVMMSEDTCWVKLADIEDNTTPWRMDTKAARKMSMYVDAYEKICNRLGITRIIGT